MSFQPPQESSARQAWNGKVKKVKRLPPGDVPLGCCCSKDKLGCILTSKLPSVPVLSEKSEAASSQDRWRKVRPEPNQRAISEAAYNAVVNRRRAARNCTFDFVSFKGRRGRKLNNCSRCEPIRKVRGSRVRMIIKLLTRES